jgi:APA family basic amino acid/polyamine antiporter
VVGLLIYFSYSEKQAAAHLPQVLVPGRGAVSPADRYTVCVPLSNPDTVTTLLSLAGPLARAAGGRIVALAVVQVPRQLPVHEGLRFTHHKEPLFKAAREYAAAHDVQLDTDVVIAHRVHDGILDAARRYRADLLVMGWKGYTNTRERMFGEVADQVIRHAPCDLIVLKIAATREFHRVLLPTAGGPHARLATEFLSTLAAARDLEVTACYVLPSEATPEEQREAERRLEGAASEFGDDRTKTRIIRARTIAGGIAKASRDFDLVVLGAAREPLFRRVLFGEIPEKVARYSPAAVMVVKRYEGAVKSLLKRALG